MLEINFTSMINRKIQDAIKAAIFEEEPNNVYAVLDGAAIPDLLDNLYEQQPEYVCLYRGELEPDIAEAAPYLVNLERDTVFSDWIIEKGWGNHWGIYALSDETMPVLRNHFRRFLIVSDPENKPLYFRYYDPRVLRTYLPICGAKDLANVFGPVTSYYLESEYPKVASRFRMAAGSLFRDEVAIAEN
jgi:hypothetical protein